MRSAFVLIPALFIIGCAPAAPSQKQAEAQGIAQPEDTRQLDRFVGSWKSTQDQFGKPATSTMNWSFALEQKFIRLDYAIHPYPDEDGVSMFSGVAYYTRGDGPDLQAFWADTSGDLHPIKATLEDGVLTSIWGVEGQKLGKTQYVLYRSESIEVTDWIYRDGEFKQFNQNKFVRESYATRD